MSKKRNRTFPVCEKSPKGKGGKKFGSADFLMHCAGMPICPASFVHNDKTKNPKNIRQKSKNDIRKGEW